MNGIEEEAVHAPATAASTSTVERKIEPSFDREWLNAALIRWNRRQVSGTSRKLPVWSGVSSPRLTPLSSVRCVWAGNAAVGSGEILEFNTVWLEADSGRVSEEFVRYLDSELLSPAHPLRQFMGQDFPKVMRELVALQPK